MKQVLFVIAFFLYTVNVFSQDKCQQVFGVLDKVKDVCQAYPPQDYCNIFVGQAISDLYQIDDFKLSSSPTGYYDANSIVLNLFTTWSNNWENLGKCNNQDVLSKGQDAANSNRCVIAVWRNPNPNSPGHISLLLPGQLKLSTSWNLNVPNAANFAMNAPEHNFVCDRLSGAFGSTKINAVYLFVHKD